jgi:molybdopterin-containing oxidoreductase family membrane subunit
MSHPHSDEALERIPWVEPAVKDFTFVTNTISQVVENPQPKWWWTMFIVSFITMCAGVVAAVYLISTGIGVWGSNNPVYWAFDITNFVFWIGIGHAGTLISAILFLFRQKWRTSINRFAEAMTIFAVICAGIYPGIHVGRFWYAWFMFPLPNANHIWQNFRSALLWDLFAVSTYFSVSLLFWYTGLLPDLATLRDRAKTVFRKKIFGFLSLGWRGSTRHWRHYEIAYLILAGFSTPLVLSVHSVVSFDFATSVVAGWHTTIFPPYFVAGAIFGGFAMVLQCMIPVRMMYPGIKQLVTPRHMDVMAKFILATGTLVGYAYAMEFFIAWYSGVPNELQIFLNRATGNYAWAYWIMVSCNLFIPQLLWMKSWRTNPLKLFVIVTFVNIGMWFERFVIIVQSLHRDDLPASWGDFYPSWVDWMQMIGDFGLFFTFTLLFLRFLPMIAMSEVKGILPNAQPHAHGDNSHVYRHQCPTRLLESELVTPTPGGSGKPYAVVAEFDGPVSLKEAAETLRDEGFNTLDAYTPYPVHGMVKAIGQPRSYIPWITICGSITGLSLAILLQFYLSAVYYPLITQGKETTSWEAFVPIMFEMTVLFSAFFTFFGLIGISGFPRMFHPLDQYNRLTAATDNGFFLVVEAIDTKFDLQTTPQLLKDLGGYNVAVVQS